MSRSARPSGELTPSQFFFRKRAFTLAEFLERHPRHTAKTATALFAYYVKRGVLWRIKRGLYQDTDSFDWVAIAARWAPDAVIGYAAALWLHTPESRRSEDPPEIAVFTRTRCRAHWVNERRVLFPVQAPRFGLPDLSSVPWEAGSVLVTSFGSTSARRWIPSGGSSRTGGRTRPRWSTARCGWETRARVHGSGTCWSPCRTRSPKTSRGSPCRSARSTSMRARGRRTTNA